MVVGVLTIEIHLPGCGSLKEKRSRLKPLIVRLQREFSIAVAEVGLQDVWQDAAIACAMVSNNGRHVERSLQKVSRWIEHTWPDVTVVGDRMEFR